MSFGYDIYSLITADASINIMTSGGGIYYLHAPDNFDLTKNWLIYNFNISEIIDCLISDLSNRKYELFVKVICDKSDTLETLSGYVMEYLNGNSIGNIDEIRFVRETHSMDLEKNVYVNVLEFNLIYQE